MTEPGAPERPRSRFRSRSFTFGCLLLGGLLAVVSTAQPWWRAAGGGTTVAFKGTEATGGLSQALAVVALAGMLLVLVLRVRGRRVLAVLLAAAGLAVVLVGALRLRPTGDAVRTKLAEVSLINQYALSPTAWPWVFALSGVVVAVGAVALLLGAPSWSAGTDRFDRPGTEPLPAATDDPAGIWKAQDAGLDPTAGAEEEPSAPGDDPDVHIDDRGVTMVANSRTGRERPGRADPGPNVSGGRGPAGHPTPSPE